MSQTVKLRRSATSGSVPTTSQLALGELAINTYDGKLYLKKNVSGTESIVEIGANNLADTFHVYEYSVTANTTVFQGSDDNSHTLSYTTGSPPRIAVYLNGLLLDWGTDFTATNGSSVTLSSAAVSGDLVQIQAYKSTVVAGSNLMFADNIKAQFGDDGDLEIYHDGSNSYIADVGTGSLNVDTNGLGMSFRHTGSNPAKNMAQMTQYGVTLNYDGATKLTTTSGGVTVSGALTIGTNDLITEESGQLKIQSGQGVVVNIDNNDSGPDLFRITKGSTGSNILQITTNDNSSTFSGKVSSTGFNLDDNYKAQFGTGNDFGIKHDGSHTYLQNSTGHVYFQQLADDMDIVFQSDDGSGGVTEYYRLDGSESQNRYSRHVKLSDSVELRLGTDNDAVIKSDGTNTTADNYTGDLLFRQNVDDKDIIFQSDNGSGGLADYIRLDGSNTRTIMSKNVIHQDDVRAFFGGGNDLAIYHDGTSQDGFIINNTEDLIIRNDADDKDVIIQADNGSGGRIAYFRADGSTGEAKLLHYGNLKLTTQSGGVLIAGELESDSLDVNGAADISGNLTVGGNTTITGNLTVNGTQTVLNTSTLTVDDLNITIADGAANATAANGAGITIDGANATWTYSLGDNAWKSNKHILAYTGDGTGSFAVGRDANQAIQIDVSDNYNKITAHQDSDENGDHFFDLIRDFDGTGRADFRIINGSTVNMLVDKDGHVGIGHNTPDYPLHIKETVTNAGAVYIEDGTSWLRVVPNLGGGGFNPIATAGDVGLIFSTDSDSSTDTSGSLILAPHSNSIGGIKITETGRVGIGHAAPAQRLHVNGTVEVNGNIYFDGSTTSNHTISHGTSTQQPAVSLWGEDHASYPGQVHIIGRSDNAAAHAGEISFWDYTGSGWNRNMVIRKNGNVGIGDDTPAKKLTVSGDIRITNGSAYMSQNVAGSTRSLISLGTDNVLRIKGNDSEGSNNVISMINGGDVGIGTTSPSDRLHVYENVNRTSIKVQNDNHSSKFEAYGNATAITTDAANGLFLRISDVNKVHLDNNGNFGVNVTDPKAKFQVEEYGIDTTETSTSATTQTVIHTMSASDFRSARYTIQVTNSTDSTYHTTEILMVHDGTTANITEFGKIFTANEEATFDADVSSGNVRLLATPATTDSMEFKVVCHSVTV